MAVSLNLGACPPPAAGGLLAASPSGLCGFSFYFVFVSVAKRWFPTEAARPTQLQNWCRREGELPARQTSAAPRRIWDISLRYTWARGTETQFIAVCQWSSWAAVTECSADARGRAGMGTQCCPAQRLLHALTAPDAVFVCSAQTANGYANS